MSAIPSSCRSKTWGFCTKLNLSMSAAIEGASSKAAGIYPADLARVLLGATDEDWRLVRWRAAPDAADFVADLHALGEGLLLPASIVLPR